MKNLEMAPNQNIGFENINNEVEAENLMKELKAKFDLLKQLKGEKGAKKLMGMLIDDALEKNINIAFGKITEKEEAVEKGLKVLEEEGIIDYGENGEIICDLDKIKNDLNFEILKKCGAIYNSPYYGNNSKAQALFLLFHDKTVISKEDYRSGKSDGKSLFYLPQTKEDALDIEKIKKNEFYLNLSEVVNVKDYKKTKYGDISDLDYREVLLPLLIYHPKYLDGYRDENGKLMIKNEKGEYRKMSGEYFAKRFGRLPLQVEEKNPTRSLVVNHLPDLVKSGLLLPEDFSISAGKDYSYRLRAVKKTQKRGEVMYNKINYNLGAKYSSQNGYQAINLSQNLGGIINKDENGERKIEAVFDFMESTEGLSIHDKNRKTYTASAKQCGVREFKIQEFLPQRAGESETEYQERIAEVSDLSKLLDFSNKVAKEADVNLLDYDFSDQISLVAIYNKNQDEFINFAQRFQDDGLKTLLKLDSLEQANNLLSQTKQEGAGEDYSYRSIFRKFNNLFADLEQVEENIKNNFSDRKDVAKIILGYREEAKNLLFAQIKEVGKDNVDEIISALDRINESIIILSVYLQTSKEERTKVDLEKIKDLESDTKEFGQEFSDKEYENKKIKAEIIALAEENWEENCQKYGISPKLKEYILSDIQKSLDDALNQEFHILKYQGNIIGFLRFENIADGEVYFASFNIKDDIKGFDVGRAMLEIVKNKAKSNTVYASAPLKIDAVDYYSKMGFEGVGYKTNENFGYEPIIELKMDLNAEREKVKSIEDLQKEYGETFHQDMKNLLGAEYVGRTYSLPEDMDKYQEELEYLLSNGYKLVNYRREGGGQKKDCYLEFVKTEKFTEQKKAA